MIVGCYVSRLAHGFLDFGVQNEDHGCADCPERVGARALEHGGEAFVLQDLAEAVERAAVEPLFLGLVGLHLESPPDGVERVGDVAGGDGGGLRDDELGGEAQEGVVAFVVGVGVGERVEHAEVHAAVGEDAHHGDAEAVLERAGALGGGLGEAVAEAAELALAGADVRREARARVVERLDDGQRARAREPAGEHVDAEARPELLLLVDLGEHGLEDVFEREVEALRRELAQHVREVAPPEGVEALLRLDAREAVDDALLALHFPAADAWVRVLCLNDQFHSLDRSRDCFRDCAGDSSS